ncbi:MAG: benzoate transporter [Alphaproteobacteria bacterium]|nr:benzoate transporter [Alphaproteobacteria bacterium]
MTIEGGQWPLPRPGEIWRDFGTTYAASAFVAFVFAASGPVAVVLSVGAQGGLSESDMASWLFGCFFINSLVTIPFCLIYRQPLVFFWTIPGTVLVGPALETLTFPEVIGAFYATGVLMLLLGLTGWVKKPMSAIPMPIVMAMVAGVFLKFGIDLIFAMRDDFWIAAPMAAAFVALTGLPRLGRYLPPLIGALVVGIIAMIALDAFAPFGAAPLALAPPTIQMPDFSWQAMVELVVPLAITVLVVQNGQGFAVLTAAGHKPPINAIASACGFGSMAVAVVGTAPTCLTGPVNAILAGSGEKSRQYTAGLFVAFIALVFGILAPIFTRFMLATPPSFIAALAGLAMLRVLQTSFNVSFRGRFTLGALMTFLVTVADISIFNIGAPFWGLVFGFATSWILERDDFRHLMAGNE